MTWAKFDDGYFRNRKVRRVDSSAIFLHMTAIIHCAGLENDGVFDKADLALIAAEAKIPPGEVCAIAEKLVAERLFEDRGDTYVVHDFLDYNPSREECQARREATATRVKMFRTRQQRNNDGNAVTNAAPDPGSFSQIGSLDQDQRETRTNHVSLSVSNGVTAIVTGWSLLTTFGKLRREVLQLQSPPGTETPKDTNGKASTFAEHLTPSEASDAEPTMRLMLEHIKAGDVRWTDQRLNKSGFAFGAWMSNFSDLREELHGVAPSEQSLTTGIDPDWRSKCKTT